MEILDQILGLNLKPEQLTVLQICLRGLVVFISTIIMIKLGHKRFLAKRTAFDVVLGLVLASSLSRGINGSAAFFPTLVLGFWLIFLHRVLDYLAFRFKFIGILVKGKECDLIHEGVLQRRAMEKHCLSEDDVLEDMRLNKIDGDFSNVKLAKLERSGEISFVKNNDDKKQA